MKSRDQKTLVRLERDDWWPSVIRKQFCDLIRLGDGKISIEDTVRERINPFYSMALSLEEVVRNNRLLVYHSTKEPCASYYQEQGLRILNIQQHRGQFLKSFSHLFTAGELSSIQIMWDSVFYKQQEAVRERMIWFAFAPDQVVSDGTELFFKYYGGEAIYWALMKSPKILAKLSRIGNPVVVEVSVNPVDLKTFGSLPFAINSMTLALNRINPKTCVCGREGYLQEDVPSTNIIRVVPKDVFFKEYRKKRTPISY